MVAATSMMFLTTGPETEHCSARAGSISSSNRAPGDDAAARRRSFPNIGGGHGSPRSRSIAGCAKEPDAISAPSPRQQRQRTLNPSKRCCASARTRRFRRTRPACSTRSKRARHRQISRGRLCGYVETCRPVPVGRVDQGRGQLAEAAAGGEIRNSQFERAAALRDRIRALANPDQPRHQSEGSRRPTWWPAPEGYCLRPCLRASGRIRNWGQPGLFLDGSVRSPRDPRGLPRPVHRQQSRRRSRSCAEPPARTRISPRR